MILCENCATDMTHGAKIPKGTRETVAHCAKCHLTSMCHDIDVAALDLAPLPLDLPFCSVTRCPKCGFRFWIRRGSLTITYLMDGNCLEKTCSRCSFSWREQPMT